METQAETAKQENMKSKKKENDEGKGGGGAGGGPLKLRDGRNSSLQKGPSFVFRFTKSRTGNGIVDTQWIETRFSNYPTNLGGTCFSFCTESLFLESPKFDLYIVTQ